MKTEKTELWGTFSVKDHNRPYPFVTEVLLYDRLVIPRPPTPDEEKHKPNTESQNERWTRAGWRPNRLTDLLNILKEVDADLVVDLPWNQQAQQDWQKLYSESVADQIGTERAKLVQSTIMEIDTAKEFTPEQAPYVATGGLIGLYVAGAMHNKSLHRLMALTKTPGVSIDPVIAYGAYQDFEVEQRMQVGDQGPIPGNVQPYALFGWDFFVPDHTNEGEYELLRKAARLASRKDLREVRQYFHGWLKQIHEGNVSLEEAQDKMLQMLDEYRGIIKGSGLKTVVGYVAKVAPIIAPLAGLINREAGIIASVSVGGASLMIQPLITKPEPDERVRSAALIYDIRRFFGKK